MQVYSDPSRESDPHALPDVEVFYINERDAHTIQWYGPDSEPLRDAGWYYWSCFPGCLPDSEPIGPFATADAAKAAAQDDGDLGDYGVNAGSHIDPSDLA